MMKPTRPLISKGGSYPQEFREEAVRYWLSSGQTLAVVADDLGLSPECLRSWHKSMEDTSPHDVTLAKETNSASELALAREIGHLRRELEAMTCQRDILKRLLASVPRCRAESLFFGNTGSYGLLLRDIYIFCCCVSGLSSKLLH
jgi:transposase-like protein